MILMGFVPFASRAQGEKPARVDLRVMGADLVDETVYSWLKSSPFNGKTPLIVAEIDAPIGLDHRFSEAVENHLFEVLRANPRLPVELVHCGLCRQWVAVSSPKKTVIGRALQQPEALEQLKIYPHLHALSLHFDVVADDLVLWAEIYEVKAPQRVVWAQRFSHATSARSVLQDPARLTSLAEARADQERQIKGRDVLQLVTRFPIRNYAAKTNSTTGGATEVAPLIFAEQSLEAILSPNRDRRAGLSVGLTSLKDTLQGWTLGAHYMQLLGRTQPSLTAPDFYFKAGVSYLRLEGPTAAVFGQNQVDIARIINAQEEPKASLTAYQIGFEAHVKYRFGFSAFIEYVPTLEENQLIETRSFVVPFHAVGFAGVFLW